MKKVGTDALREIGFGSPIRVEYLPSDPRVDAVGSFIGQRAADRRDSFHSAYLHYLCHRRWTGCILAVYGKVDALPLERRPPRTTS